MVIHCFTFSPFLSYFGSYLYGGESRQVATNCRCRQQKSIRRQAVSEIEEGSYRFLCLFLVSFLELVWFTLVRYYFEPSRDEHIPIVNKNGCLHSCFFPWNSWVFIFSRSFSDKVWMGDGRGGRDHLCSSYNEVPHWKPVKRGQANRHPKKCINQRRKLFCCCNCKWSIGNRSVWTKRNSSEYQWEWS